MNYPPRGLRTLRGFSCVFLGLNLPVFGWKGAVFVLEVTSEILRSFVVGEPRPGHQVDF